jgi:hypothetical protein
LGRHGVTIFLTSFGDGPMTTLSSAERDTRTPPRLGRGTRSPTCGRLTSVAGPVDPSAAGRAAPPLSVRVACRKRHAGAPRRSIRGTRQARRPPSAHHGLTIRSVVTSGSSNSGALVPGQASSKEPPPPHPPKSDARRPRTRSTAGTTPLRSKRSIDRLRSVVASLIRPACARTKPRTSSPSACQAM